MDESTWGRLLEWLGDEAPAEAPAGAPVIVHSGELFRAFLADLADGRRPQTAAAYRYKVGAWLEWTGAGDPHARTAQAWINHLQEAGRMPATLQVSIAALRAWFRWLEARGLGGPPPAMRGPRGGEQERLAPTSDEVSRLFDGAMSMPHHTLRERYERGRARAVLALLLHCGLRRSEILGLDRADIEIRPRLWMLNLRVTKGGESGRVGANAVVQLHLGDWFPIRQAWRERYHHTSDALFPLDRVRRLSHNGFVAIWRDLLSRAGIERHITPHGARHWIGTMAEGLGDLKTAQVILRHRRPETTFQYLKTHEQSVAFVLHALEAYGGTLAPVASAQPVPIGQAQRPAGPRFRRRRLPGHTRARAGAAESQ